MTELDPSIKFTTFERHDFENIYGNGNLSSLGSNGKISEQVEVECIGAQVGECAGVLKSCKKCPHCRTDHQTARVLFKQNGGHVFDESKPHITKAFSRTSNGLPVEAVFKHHSGRVLLGYKVG